MFTGLVEEVATLQSITHEAHSAHLQLAVRRIQQGLQIGDSIAVSGVCLTVVTFTASGFVADAVPETIRRTSLGQLRPGDQVNVERALRVGDRLGGHIVSGHVDGIGRITDVAREGIATVITMTAKPDVMRYIVEKGSICVDGVSLTVMDVQENTFRVSLIPHTGHETTLGNSRVGRTVNLECDVLAKYVERLLTPAAAAGQHKQALSMDFLAQNGFA